MLEVSWLKCSTNYSDFSFNRMALNITEEKFLPPSNATTFFFLNDTDEVALRDEGE